MKIKTILKESKRQIDEVFGVESIIIPKYYYDKYDMLFVNIGINNEMSMNVQIRKGWNGSENCICVLNTYTDSNGCEQEGYASNIRAEKENTDDVIEEIIQKLKNSISVEARVSSWNVYYDYDARYNKLIIDKWFGDKYSIINNKLTMTHPEDYKKCTGRELAEYLNGLIKNKI